MPNNAKNHGIHPAGEHGHQNDGWIRVPLSVPSFPMELIEKQAKQSTKNNYLKAMKLLKDPGKLITSNY